MNVFYNTDKNPPTFFTCGNLISENGFLHCRRNFDCNVLIYVLEGTLFISQSERRFSVSAGEFIFLTEGEEHYGFKAADGKLSYMWVHFRNNERWKMNASDSLPQDNAFSHLIFEYGRAVVPQRINMLFHQLLDFSRQENLYSTAILQCSLNLLLMEFTQECLDNLFCREKNVSPIVAAASEWIKSNCHKQLSISDIADEFHYNAEYLSALFKKETGLTLVRFINKTKIEVSKNLLSDSNIGIKEAAYSCGFSDEKYYMKMFKKYAGMTPLEYRNSFYKKAVN